MIKAINVIEDPPAELAYLMWQWLQEQKFQFSGRMYLLSPKFNDYDNKISIYSGTHSYSKSNWWYIELVFKDSIVFVPHKRNRSWWMSHRVWKSYDVSDPQKFEHMLEHIRWLLPK